MFSCDLKIANKFRGQYIEIQPNGMFHLEFKNNGHHYTWGKAKNYMNNILIGKMFANVQGEETILNHNTNDVCNLKYWPCTMFSTDSINKVTGLIKDSKNVTKYTIEGVCTDKLDYTPVTNAEIVKSHDDIKKLNKGSSKPLWQRFEKP